MDVCVRLYVRVGFVPCCEIESGVAPRGPIVARRGGSYHLASLGLARSSHNPHRSAVTPRHREGGAEALDHTFGSDFGFHFILREA